MAAQSVVDVLTRCFLGAGILAGAVTGASVFGMEVGVGRGPGAAGERLGWVTGPGPLGLDDGGDGVVWLRRDGAVESVLAAGSDGGAGGDDLWRPCRGRMRVRIASAEAEALAVDYQLRWKSVAGLPMDWRVAVVDPARLLVVLQQLRDDPRVREVEPVLGARRLTRAVPDDFFFPRQWHLLNTGQNGGTAGQDINVVGVWGDFGVTGVRGAGVRLGIVDDGLESGHPDLAADAMTDRDWPPANQFGGPVRDDANPFFEADNHGTAVAGIAAARGNNGLGVCGVAPEAQLVGLRLLGGARNGVGVFLDDLDVAESFSYLAQSGSATIDIKNNSWGPVDERFVLEAPGPLAAAALRWSAVHGRDGRGTVFVFASGNGRESGEDANLNGHTNFPEVICVAAVLDDGSIAPYSEPGACVMVCAPGGPSEAVILGLSKDGLLTTDRSGTQGYNFNPASANNGFTRTFNGTSAAAPVVSGVVALMLETNPALGWRDVQEILVRTARTHRPSDPGWFTNGVGWDFHPDFGAGLVDAEASVELAASWSPLAHLKAADAGVVDLITIPDANPTGLTIPLVLTSTQLRAERVTVDVRLLHSRRGQLQLELTSPSGTTSVLKPVMSGDTQADFSPWLFSSVHFWGEAADGVWTLRCIDTQPEITGALVSADLRVFGTSPQKDDYEFWLDEQFTASVVSDPAQFGVWGPAADPDGDGWSNVAEAYFSMRPEVSDAPAVWQVAVTERQMALRWRPGSLDEVEATPQWSPDLVHWYQGDEAPDGVERGFERFSDGSDEVAVLSRQGLEQAYIRLSIARLPSQL